MKAKLDSLPADMVMLDLVEEGNYFAVRPSGTEPKVKFYMFSYCSPADSSDLPAAKKRLGERLAALEKDIRAYVQTRYRLKDASCTAPQSKLTAQALSGVELE